MTFTKVSLANPLKVLGITLLVIAAFLYGYFSHRNRLLPHTLGLVLKNRYFQDTPGLWWESSSGKRTLPDEDLLRNLSALPYLSGYQRPPKQTGVVVYKQDEASPGYNLYTSGHAPQALLIDMQGQLVYQWGYDTKSGPYWYRRVYLYKNGDLLALEEHCCLYKLNKDSELLWFYDENVHHDFSVTPDGPIYVLAREEVSYGDLCGGKSMWDDLVVELDPATGIPKAQLSITQAFANSKYASLLQRMVSCTQEEIFHTNTIDLISSTPAEARWPFQKGNVLISSRELDTIAVIDLKRGTVVWALTGMWRYQHEPTLLENGHLLLFDNLGHKGFSKVIEFEPFTQEIVWSYEGNEANGFVSEVLGSNQRLPNGNTLITESTAGRAFEVTAAGEIVWEFVNPERPLESRDKIAVVPEMIRLPREFPLTWID